MSGRVIDLQEFRARKLEPYVSKAVLALFFGVSLRTVDRWVSAGCPRLKSYPGAWPRFRRLEVKDWLEGR